MGLGEEVDGDGSTLDRGAGGRGELYNPVVFAHGRTGEDGDTPATLIEGGTCNVHPRKKMLEKGVESSRRSRLDLLKKDVVETFVKTYPCPDSDVSDGDGSSSADPGEDIHCTFKCTMLCTDDEESCIKRKKMCKSGRAFVLFLLLLLF